MKVILRLRATHHLTEQQVLTAARFRKDPNRFKLAPTGFRLLHDVILRERPLEQIEQTRGWAARSAKVVVSVLLHMIEETEGIFWCKELDGTAEEMVAYLKGEEDHELLDLQQRLSLQPTAARILQVLLHAKRPVSFGAQWTGHPLRCPPCPSAPTPPQASAPNPPFTTASFIAGTSHPPKQEPSR
jgi:hypothetical protein